MMNQALWTIDNELDGATFQRLCIDLLYRNGYREIVPIEPQDGGRDAEEFPRQGRGRAGEAAFYSAWRTTGDRTGRLRLSEASSPSHHPGTAQTTAQQRPERFGQHHLPVAPPFALPDADQMPVEIEIPPSDTDRAATPRA